MHALDCLESTGTATRNKCRSDLEEAFIFPAVKRAGGPAAGYADVLKVQHDRGPEVTDYILAVTGKGVIGTGDTEPLARGRWRASW